MSKSMPPVQPPGERYIVSSTYMVEATSAAAAQTYALKVAEDNSHPGTAVAAKVEMRL